MRIIGLLGAGALAAATLAAVPAEAQRYGYDGYRDGRGWHDGHRGYRGGYRDGYRNHRGGYRGYHRDGRGPRWNGGYRGRPRVVCRWTRSHYGPVRRCFDVRR